MTVVAEGTAGVVLAGSGACESKFWAAAVRGGDRNAKRTKIDTELSVG